MCLVGLVLGEGDDGAVLLVGNRDEEHARPTAEAHAWSERPDVYAGKDLRANGTWMGVTQGGRWAALTNFRHPEARREGASRGSIVRDYLLGDEPPLAFAEKLVRRLDALPSFNLIVGHGARAVYLADERGGSGPRVEPLAPGVHTLSNARLGEPWPKTRRLDAALRRAEASAIPDLALFEVLADRSGAPDDELPSTGVPLALERFLAAPFLVSPGYGTRASTIVRVTGGAASLIERSFDARGAQTGEVRLGAARSLL